MTVRKAISGLDFLIQNKQQVKTGILDPQMSWNREEPFIRDFVESMGLLL